MLFKNSFILFNHLKRKFLVFNRSSYHSKFLEWRIILWARRGLLQACSPHVFGWFG